MRVLLLLIPFLFYSCATSQSHKNIGSRKVASLELDDMKQALYEQHARASDLDSLPVRWVTSEALTELTDKIPPTELKNIVIRYAAKDGDYADKVAYFSYNKFLRFYLNRAQTNAQLEAIDELFKAVDSELITGQYDDIGVDKLLVDGSRPRSNMAHRHMMNQMVQSDRLMHLLHSHLEVIVASDSGPAKFKELFKATQRLSPVRQYISYHGNSSASSSSWIFNNYKLSALTEMIREAAKSQRTFEFVTDLIKTIPAYELLEIGTPFESPWNNVPNFDERAQRQAYGQLYYTLANKPPLADNFSSGMGNEYTFRMKHRESLMNQRKENLVKALGQIDFSYFRSAEDLKALDESLKKFESVDELIFYWKNVTHGEDIHSAKYRLHAKLRNYGLVSELTNKYLLLPKYVQEANIEGPRSAPRNFDDIARGRLSNPWEIEFDNIGGYEDKEKARFSIYHSAEVFDDLTKNFKTEQQMLAFEGLLEKLNTMEIELSLYSGSTYRMPTSQYLLHEVSSPIDKVNSQWLRYIAIDKKSSGVIFPIKKLATNSQKAMWLVFFEKRMIDLIEDQFDLDAYLRLSKLLNLETDTKMIDRLNGFLSSHKNAKPVHIEHILTHWNEFEGQEKISLTPEFMDEHLKKSRQVVKATQQVSLPSTTGSVAPRSKSCFEIIGNLLRF